MPNDVKKTNKINDMASNKSNLVSMSNALNRASHNLTLTEKRLIAISISLLDSRRDPPGFCPVVTFTASEYAETFGLDVDVAYEQMKQGIKYLYERTIRFAENEGKARKIWQMRWVGAANYMDKEGRVELQFWHAVVPHLMGLKRDFTSYQLKQTRAIRSVYSWRMLELLSRFKSNGWMQISIEDFNHALELSEKQSSNFSYARRKIIEPAIKELREKNGLEITYRTIKKGVKIGSLYFEFQERTQTDLFLDC